MNLSAIKVKMLNGNELFFDSQQKYPITVLDFWKWKNSDLLNNANRGILVEFIVASALDIHHLPRMEWDSFDLMTNDGLKIEVKSSAYLQSWNQNKLSSISFSIRETLGWDYETNIYSNEFKRQSDLYVFCLLNHKDKKTVQPLNLNQWDFYIVLTNEINDKLGKQKSMGLSTLLSLHHKKVTYDELKESIEAYNKN